MGAKFHVVARKTETVSVVKPTAMLTMPMELVQSLGKMHTTVITSFESTTNHGAPRLIPPSHPVFAELHVLYVMRLLPPLPTPMYCISCKRGTIACHNPSSTYWHHEWLANGLLLGVVHAIWIQGIPQHELRSPFPTCRFLPKSISKSIPTLTTKNLATFLLKHLPQWDANAVNYCNRHVFLHKHDIAKGGACMSYFIRRHGAICNLKAQGQQHSHLGNDRSSDWGFQVCNSLCVGVPQALCCQQQARGHLSWAHVSNHPSLLSFGVKHQDRESELGN